MNMVLQNMLWLTDVGGNKTVLSTWSQILFYWNTFEDVEYVWFGKNIPVIIVIDKNNNDELVLMH